MKDTSQSDTAKGQERADFSANDASAGESRTRDALRLLHDSLQAAWIRARPDAAPGAAAMGPAQSTPVPPPPASTATTLHEVFGDFGQLGIAVAEDAMRLAQEWGASVGESVRRHPVRTLAIAAIAGAALGLALRARRSPSDESP